MKSATFFKFASFEFAETYPDTIMKASPEVKVFAVNLKGVGSTGSSVMQGIMTSQALQPLGRKGFLLQETGI
jgi:hypothetical protein